MPNTKNRKQWIIDRCLHRLKKAILQDISSAKKYTVDELVDNIIEHDPSFNKKYSFWISLRYAQQDFMVEDLFKVKQTLKNFIRAGNRINNDIYSYKNYHELLIELEKIDVNSSITKSEKRDQEKKKAYDESIILKSTEDYEIIISKTFESAKYWGLGTHWCTSLNENYFKSY